MTEFAIFAVYLIGIILALPLVARVFRDITPPWYRDLNCAVAVVCWPIVCVWGTLRVYMSLEQIIVFLIALIFFSLWVAL